MQGELKQGPECQWKRPLHLRRPFVSKNLPKCANINPFFTGRFTIFLVVFHINVFQHSFCPMTKASVIIYPIIIGLDKDGIAQFPSGDF